MRFFAFGRFHAREGREEILGAALLDMADKTRAEPGCLAVHVFRSSVDPRQYQAYTEWRDEETFEIFANKAYSVDFVDHLLKLIDHQLDLTLSQMIF